MVRSEHKIDLVGFGVLRFAQQKEREGAGIPGGCSSPAKGRAGEYATNGAAAGPVVAASKGTPREEESGEETEMSLSGRAVNEPISSETTTSSSSSI